MSATVNGIAPQPWLAEATSPPEALFPHIPVVQKPEEAAASQREESKTVLFSAGASSHLAISLDTAGGPLKPGSPARLIVELSPRKNDVREEREDVRYALEVVCRGMAFDRIRRPVHMDVRNHRVEFVVTPEGAEPLSIRAQLREELSNVLLLEAEYTEKTGEGDKQREERRMGS